MSPLPITGTESSSVSCRTADQSAGRLGLPLLIIPPDETPLHKYEVKTVVLGEDARTATVDARARGWRLRCTMHWSADGSWYHDYAPVTRERVVEER